MGQKQPRVAVLGGGSWGTTVASNVSRSAPTVLWSRSPHTVADVNDSRRNRRYLGEVELHAALSATASLEAAVSDADVVVMGVPSHAFRGVLEESVPHLRPWVPVVSLVKGLEQGTDRRPLPRGPGHRRTGPAGRGAG